MSDERVEEFLVPDLGEGLQDVTVLAWEVAAGDDVELNQPLCSVETAKAEVEIPSPYTGRIVEIRGAPGDVLEVGSLLARIAVTTGVPGTRIGEPADSVVAGEAGGGDGGPARRRPVLVGFGTDDGADVSRRPPSAGGRPRTKPAVRRLAADLGVDLTTVPPGADGIITRDAVLAVTGPAADDADELVPLGAVQMRMAERMARSHSDIPAAAARLQVDGTNLARLRERIDDAAITPFVLMLRLVVLALTRHRVLNASWVPTGPQLRIHRGVHLGFAVAAPRGLLVPVVGDAQDRTTRELADEVARLIAGARAGTLTPTELTGSTFTVTNFGALGLDDGTPVINHPEAAILGIGSLKPRPAVVGDTLVIRPQATLTCVFDHRVVDGAQAAAFLTELGGLIEAPATALADL